MSLLKGSRYNRLRHFSECSTCHTNTSLSWQKSSVFHWNDCRNSLCDFWVWFSSSKMRCFQRMLIYAALHSPWVLVSEADIFPVWSSLQWSKSLQRSFDSKQVWTVLNCSAPKYFDRRLVKFIDYTINLGNSLSRYRSQRWQSVILSLFGVQ